MASTIPQAASAASAQQDLYAMRQTQLAEASALLGLKQDMTEVLSQCKRELVVHFPVRMDDGSVRSFTGYRVQHNMARGPTKGGIRYHPGVSLG